MQKPTHYINTNIGGALFVKEAHFFQEQGGLVEPWGESWIPVIAGSIEEAREQASIIFNIPLSEIYKTSEIYKA